MCPEVFSRIFARTRARPPSLRCRYWPVPAVVMVMSHYGDHFLVDAGILHCHQFLSCDLVVWYCLCMALSLLLHLCHELEPPLSTAYTLFSLRLLPWLPRRVCPFLAVHLSRTCWLGCSCSAVRLCAGRLGDTSETPGTDPRVRRPSLRLRSIRARDLVFTRGRYRALGSLVLARARRA